MPRFDHITPVLADLHWLPVRYRIKFKILLLVFKALMGKAPQYIRDMVRPRQSLSHKLRSSSAVVLMTPSTKCKTFGDRAFQSSAPTLWNQLPGFIRMAEDTVSFKGLLKEHFFNEAFKHLL